MPSTPSAAPLSTWLAETAERNRDNVTRTESYLELYAYTRANPPDLPWLLMAHLVSRNGGYMMTDTARALAHGGNPMTPAALETLFLFLERANFLIFHDAWWHVAHAVAGRAAELSTPRTTRYVCQLWREHAAHPDERRLVEGLVTNEQNFIERRVVHHARLAVARTMIDFFEAARIERPIVLPSTDAEIRVDGFAQLARRIDTGMRIFDAALADRGRREHAYEWARAHPHTGSRAVYGGRAGLTIREEAWPVDRVRALWEGIYADPELDPDWP